MDSIFERRSVRKFNNKEIEKDKIEKILRAGMQAPSAGNQQSSEFIVVRGKEKLKELSDCSEYSGCLKDANVAIIVLGNTSKMRFYKHWEQDLGATTENILLEATELNLGSVWLGIAPTKERMDTIKKLYSLSDELLPFSIVALGYPTEENANHFIDRYDEKKVHYIE